MKHFSAALLVFASLCVLTACKTTKKPDSYTVDTKHFSSTRTTFLTDEHKDSLYADFQIDFPVVSSADSASLASIQKQILSALFTEKYQNLSIQSALSRFQDDIAEDYIRINLPMATEDGFSEEELGTILENEHTCEAVICSKTKKTFSYQIDRYMYMGGAHGLHTTHYYVYCLATGKQLTEDLLFCSGYKDKLQQLLISTLMEQLELADEDELIGMNFQLQDILPNNNFYLTDQGLNYVYNVYEIAPYVMGQTEISLSWEKLQPLLHPNHPAWN